MKFSKFVLFLVLLIATSLTGVFAQKSQTDTKITPKSVGTAVKTAPKPVGTAVKTTPKPVAAPVKVTSKSVATPVKKTVKTTPTHTTPTRTSVPSNVARIQFENPFFDLGTIKEDAVLEKNFEFTNVGATDLVIINAEGSCGCTLPTIPNYPIPPGGKGKILVKYTAKNKVGPQKPVVTVTTNGVPSTVKLNMEAWVDQIPGGVKDGN